jgi:apolipoprotein N-acyltransferase
MQSAKRKAQSEKLGPRRRLGWVAAAIRGVRRRRLEIGLSAASGLGLACALPTINAWPLGFFALAPFLWAMRRFEGKAAFFLGLWFGFVFNYAALFWLNSVWFFAPTPLLSVPAIVLLALYLGLYHGLFAWAGAWMWRRRPKSAVLALPALWVVLEWFRSLGRLGLPWAFLAHTQSENLPYIQMADLAGTAAISFCLAAINVLLVEILQGRFGSTEQPRQRLGPPACLGALALLVAVPYIYGAIQLNRTWEGEGTLRVAVSQPNVDQISKFCSYAYPDEAIRAGLQKQIEENQIAQVLEMRQAAPETQLYVLPETSFTEGRFPSNTRLREKLADLAREIDGAIFFGEDNWVEDQSLGRTRRHNSAWMATPEAGILETVYDKMRLVPFGESLPYFKLIPGFQEKVLGMAVFDEGREHTVFERAGLKFGGVICFESIMPRQMAAFVRAGAQFLVVITNDAWYVHQKWRIDPRGPAQHDAHSTFRAIEARRYLVRSANTGISRIIDPAGRTIAHLGINQRDFLTGLVEGRNGLTPYIRFGEWFVALSAAFAALTAIQARRQA